MAFGSFWSGIKLVELDTTTYKPKANPILYSIASRTGSGTTAIEAPFIVYKDGYYYLFVSFDLCAQGASSTYRIMMGRSEKITGPYKDKDDYPMLFSGGTQLVYPTDQWKGPGHCAVLIEGDKSWLVYHAYDAYNNGIPTLRINRLIWDEEGWPAITDLTDIEDEHPVEAPEGFALYQNFPNPFNPSTTIKYSVEQPSWVRMTIYNLLGVEIETLINKQCEPGEYKITWHPQNLPSGVYLYQLEAGNNKFSKIKKLIFLK